jgi:hypothetical protein
MNPSDNLDHLLYPVEPIQEELIVPKQILHLPDEVMVQPQTIVPVAEDLTPDQLSLMGKAKHELSKATKMARGVLSTFFKESWEQIGEGRTLSEKVKLASLVGGVAITALAGQAGDRLRVPESLNVPTAIDTARDHGNVAGAAALGLGVYAAQFAIGSAWGIGMNRFRKTADVFDKAYPGYKDTLAEENAGYGKTLWRHSVNGLGIGNTMFVAAEVLDKPDISNFEVLRSSNRSARRIGVAATGVAFGVLTAAQANADRYILLWSVPDVVNRLEKPLTWVAIGVGAEVLPRMPGAIYKLAKSTFSSLAKKVVKTERIEEPSESLLPAIESNEVA